MSEDSAISQLGGLALGNLLSEYGLDDQARQHLGINNNSNSGFDSNDIYNEKYMDDEDQFRGMQQDDQDQDDEEEEEQDQYGSRMGNGMDRYLKQGMAAISNSNQSTSYPNGGGGGGILLPGGIRIKQEDQDDDEEEEDERMSQRSIHQEQQKPRTVEEVWQGFERGKTLDFVKLYWPESMARPLKKRKLGIMNNLQREWKERERRSIRDRKMGNLLGWSRDCDSYRRSNSGFKSRISEQDFRSAESEEEQKDTEG